LNKIAWYSGPGGCRLCLWSHLHLLASTTRCINSPHNWLVA